MSGVFDGFNGQSFAAVDMVLIIVELAMFHTKTSCGFCEGVFVARAGSRLRRKLELHVSEVRVVLLKVRVPRVTSTPQILEGRVHVELLNVDMRSVK